METAKADRAHLSRQTNPFYQSPNQLMTDILGGYRFVAHYWHLKNYNRYEYS